MAGVEFLVDDVSFDAEDTRSPYQTRWDTTTVPDGNYTLTARIRDDAGNTTITAPVVVSVDNVVTTDTTPPDVSITSPLGGATVSLLVLVTASATDNEGVASVQFLLNGEAFGSPDLVSPYEIFWDSTLGPDGSYTLAALAYDAAGNATTSPAVPVIVDNQVPGSAQFPVVAGTAVTVLAEASDNVGVVGVQFFLDGVPGPDVTTAPYSISWDTTAVANGIYVITAQARDAAGNESTSLPVSVIVSNATTGTEVELTDTITLVIPSEPTVYLALLTSEVPGTIAIFAQSSVEGVETLELYIDRQLVSTVVGSVIQYGWDTTSLSGTHEVLVLAYDALGLVASSSIIYP